MGLSDANARQKTTYYSTEASTCFRNNCTGNITQNSERFILNDNLNDQISGNLDSGKRGYQIIGNEFIKRNMKLFNGLHNDKIDDFIISESDSVVRNFKESKNTRQQRPKSVFRLKQRPNENSSFLNQTFQGEATDNRRIQSSVVGNKLRKNNEYYDNLKKKFYDGFKKKLIFKMDDASDDSMHFQDEKKSPRSHERTSYEDPGDQPIANGNPSPKLEQYSHLKTSIDNYKTSKTVQVNPEVGTPKLKKKRYSIPVNKNLEELETSRIANQTQAKNNKQNSYNEQMQIRIRKNSIMQNSLAKEKKDFKNLNNLQNKRRASIKVNALICPQKMSDLTNCMRVNDLQTIDEDLIPESFQKDSKTESVEKKSKDKISISNLSIEQTINDDIVIHSHICSQEEEHLVISTDSNEKTFENGLNVKFSPKQNEFNKKSSSKKSGSYSSEFGDEVDIVKNQDLLKLAFNNKSFKEHVNDGSRREIDSFKRVNSGISSNLSQKVKKRSSLIEAVTESASDTKKKIFIVKAENEKPNKSPLSRLRTQCEGNHFMKAFENQKSQIEASPRASSNQQQGFVQKAGSLISK